MTELHDNDFHLIKGEEIDFVPFGGESMLVIVPQVCPKDIYKCRQLVLGTDSNGLIVFNEGDNVACVHLACYIGHTIYCKCLLKANNASFERSVMECKG